MNGELSSVPISTLRGLGEPEALNRLKREGFGELPRSDQRTSFRIDLNVLREPMLALLLDGGAIYVTLGELQDALILVAFATMSVVITIVQETGPSACLRRCATSRVPGR